MTLGQQIGLIEQAIRDMPSPGLPLYWALDQRRRPEPAHAVWSWMLLSSEATELGSGNVPMSSGPPIRTEGEVQIDIFSPASLGTGFMRSAVNVIRSYFHARTDGRTHYREMQGPQSLGVDEDGIARWVIRVPFEIEDT